MVLNDIDQAKWSLGLERVQQALSILKHPERSYRHVLVSGTNGKGSTSVYLERILSVGGLRVGTTLSPHVSRFAERFRIDSHEVEEMELEGLHSEIEPILKDVKLTYFEWCVVLAAVLFERHKVDIAIFEVGLGGRYDASNVMNPDLSVITGISLDHTDFLGTTIESIAGEKAAIARPDRPLVTSAAGEALGVIERYAQTIGAHIHVIANPLPMETGIVGSSQSMNSSLAANAARILGVTLSDTDLEYALKTAFLPGRHEYVGDRIIMDVAHNPSSMEDLVKYLDSIGFYGVGVTGILADKDYMTMIRILKDACEHIFIAAVSSKRSWNEDMMLQCCELGGITRCASIKEAFHRADSTGKDVVVTGSFYCVGEIRDSIICQG